MQAITLHNELPPLRVQNAAQFGKVAVVYGGQSGEREVSLVGGACVLQALQKSGVNAIGLDKDHTIIGHLVGERFDRVFILLHGRGGEDGSFQGALDTVGIPYTGSGVLGSALAMDKRRAKQCWQQCGVPTPAFCFISDRSELSDAVAQLGYPLAIKPVHEGSSLGITRVDSAASLQQAFDKAATFDDEIIAESWIEGTEYTGSILGNEGLPLICIETPVQTFYDYSAKYSDSAKNQYHCPCGLDEAVERDYQQLSLAAFQSLGGSGWGRTDFICAADGVAMVLDVNTVPGMTSHSLMPMAAAALGSDFSELVWRILETSIR